MAHTQILHPSALTPPIAKPAMQTIPKSTLAPPMDLAQRRIPSVTWRLAASLFHTAYRLQTQGRHHIPRTGSCVFVANHSSHLDIFVLASQLPQIRRATAVPLAAADFFFRSPVLSSLSRGLLNAVPFRRDAGHRHELSYLRNELMRTGSDWSYLLFPEGTRTRNGCLSEFRSGIGALVAGSTVPVVPCHISGTFFALPADKKLPRPQGRLSVRFGAPRQFPELPNRRSGWDHVAEELRDQVEKLAP
jgi:1-acyl-sn-glycerol-3-phosphate acyltransferase